MARTVTKIAPEDPRYIQGQDLFEVKEDAFVQGVFTIDQTTLLIQSAQETKNRYMGMFDTQIAALQKQKNDMEALLA